MTAYFVHSRLWQLQHKGQCRLCGSLLQNVLGAILRLRQIAQLGCHTNRLRFAKCKLQISAVIDNVRIDVAYGRQATLLKTRLWSECGWRKGREQLQWRRWHFLTDDQILVGMLQWGASRFGIVCIYLQAVFSEARDVNAEDRQVADNTKQQILSKCLLVSVITLQLTNKSQPAQQSDHHFHVLVGALIHFSCGRLSVVLYKLWTLIAFITAVTDVVCQTNETLIWLLLASIGRWEGMVSAVRPVNYKKLDKNYSLHTQVCLSFTHIVVWRWVEHWIYYSPPLVLADYVSHLWQPTSSWKYSLHYVSIL